MLDIKTSVTQPLHDELFDQKQVKVFIQRVDLIHAVISGNKWRKLKYNIEEFQRQQKEYLVTFGGAYSNHIVATAAAGKELGIKTIGIIRGEELNESSNPYLRFASECEMKLFFISRTEYRKKADEEFISNLIKRLSNNVNPDFYILPEEIGRASCRERV